MDKTVNNLNDGAQESFELGVEAHSNGDKSRAESHYRRAIESAPGHAAALNNLGVLLEESGRLDEAEQLYRQAISARPDYVDALNNLAALYGARDRFAESEAALGQALSIEPENVTAHRQLGDVFAQTGRPTEAEKQFRHALLGGDDGVTLLKLALLLEGQKRLAESEALYREALAARPGLVNAHIRLAMLQQSDNRLDEAQSHFRQALALDPNQPQTLCGLGSLLDKIGRTEEAQACFRQALDVDPGFLNAWGNLGILCHAASKYEEAEQCYRRTLDIDPSSIEGLNNLGRVLEDAHRLGEAEQCFRQVLSIDPARIPTQLNLALVLLKAGRYEEGWPHYESRYAQSSFWGETGALSAPPQVAFPQWEGESLANRSLLIWPEQGFGDSLQFARYFPLLKARGLTRLSVACPSALARLFQEIDGVDECIVTDKPHEIAPHDFWCFTMSVPMHLGTTLASIPASVPYLHAPRAAVDRWAGRLPRAGLKVGLVWAGDPRPQLSDAHATDRRRSLNAQAYLPLLRIPGITFVSLQKGATTQPQLASLPETLRPLDFMNEVADFADTAAIIEQLDLIITVDTSVAHLAAGLGKRVWILSRFDGCWRWLQGRDDSPWYPNVRLFRQTRPGEWSDVIERVAGELEKIDPIRIA
ncbi:tetratricopeptide repeat protein [Caballeronia glebae]|uniref:Tetratricopeptide repeat protein n=1 Tax=Caballeronia glebae TaxID=1777143 RepID=A0A158BZF5_9BURK|nr:tetratricopeptide repeat protein [Caballeronia glebae]